MNLWRLMLWGACGLTFVACKPKTSASADPQQDTLAPKAVKKPAEPPAQDEPVPHIEGRGIPGVLTLGDTLTQAPKQGGEFKQVGEPSLDPNGNKTVGYALEGTKTSQSLFGTYDKEGKLAVIAIEDNAVKAPKGVHTGMPIQAVMERYGSPSKTERIDFAEQGVQPGYGYCATFAEVPTMRFCFAGRGWQERLKTWGKDVVEANLAVDAIYVVQ